VASGSCGARGGPTPGCLLQDLLWSVTEPVEAARLDTRHAAVGGTASPRCPPASEPAATSIASAKGEPAFSTSARHCSAGALRLDLTRNQTRTSRSCRRATTCCRCRSWRSQTSVPARAVRSKRSCRARACRGMATRASSCAARSGTRSSTGYAPHYDWVPPLVLTCSSLPAHFAGYRDRMIGMPFVTTAVRKAGCGLTALAPARRVRP